MKVSGGILLLVLLLINILSVNQLAAQKVNIFGKKKKGAAVADTLEVEAGKLVIFPDTLFIPSTDTSFIVPPTLKVKVRKNPYDTSDKFYDSLSIKSERTLITRKLYQLLFRTNVTELSDSLNLFKSEAPFLAYEGYRIANIKISTAEFLGGNIIDSTEVVRSSIAKAFDVIHADTKESIVSKNLLFKTGDLVSPYRLADNERILRDLPFIRDARIVIVPSLDDEKIVDIVVVTQDRLSLFIGGDFGGFDDFTLELGSRNFLGTGNKFSVSYKYAADETPKSGYKLSFQDFNLRGTFISSEINYTNFWDRKGYDINVKREFITPETKWAGGVELGDLEEIRFTKDALDTIPNEDDSIRIPYQRNFQDFWFGRAFLLKGGDNRVNISIASRLLREDFTDRPFVDADSNFFFHNSVLWLNEVVLTKRKFLKSSMIQAFGITEDIPIGYLFRVVGGYEYGEFTDRPYWGLGAAAGDFLKDIGYFSFGAEVGGFMENNKLQEGVVTVNGLYFTPLMRWHRNQFRQFVSFNYSNSIRPLIDASFGFDEGIRGISNEIQGDRKLSVNLESVLFHPLKLYGFRMASYAFADFGWIGFGGPLIDSDNFHSAIGIGFRLRNETLLFRTIQLRFGYLFESSEFDVNFSFSDPTIFGNFRSSKPELVTF